MIIWSVFGKDKHRGVIALQCTSKLFLELIVFIIKCVLLSPQDEYFHHNISGTALQLPSFESILDGGSFHCQAGNRMGTSSQSLAVTVTVESKIFLLLQVQNY